MFGLQRPRLTAEHTDSYYAATAPATDYPPLDGDREADVVVVGGGFSGVNTALELAERGREVVLLEARRVGWGASGRNGGQVIGGLCEEPLPRPRGVDHAGMRVLHELGAEGVAIVRDRVAHHGIDCDLRWGYLDVALRKRHLGRLRDNLAARRSRGYPHELRLLDRDEVAAFTGSRAYLGGLYDPTGAGHLHPLRLCQGEAAAAVILGACVHEQTPVERVEHGPRPVVHTPSGRIRARYLVLSTNAYLDGLDERLAAQMIPASSCIIATAPLPEALARTVLPSGAAVCDLRTALDYFRLTPDRRLLFGGLSNYSGRVQRDYAAIMRRKMLRVYPQLEHVAVDYAWNGQFGLSRTGLPQTGQLGPASYYIQAFSGHGVAASHMLARLVAEALDGRRDRFDLLASTAGRRFPGGALLRRPVAVAGMRLLKALDHF
jgi:glycine/D-amino acid oxidase-like deaminating enzyme